MAPRAPGIAHGAASSGPATAVHCSAAACRRAAAHPIAIMPRWLIRPCSAPAKGRRPRPPPTFRAPRRAQRGRVPARLLAQGGAARPRRDAGLRRACFARRASGARARATTSSRGSSCATARAGRSRTDRSARADFTALPARNWTLLVQGVNLHDAAADALLRRFSFLPYARLDDLMVSYAAPGGGVGPHFDSYDVFLLQGFGRRRWRYGRAGRPRAQARPAAEDPAPLRAGARRRARAGRHAVPAAALRARRRRRRRLHDVLDRLSRAVDATSSRGAFLDFLRDEVDLPAATPTPTSRPTREPARIGAAMQRRCARMLAASRVGPRRRSRASSAAGCRSRSRRVLRPAAARRCRAPRSPRRSRATACASTGARSCSTTTGSCSSTAARAPGRRRRRRQRMRRLANERRARRRAAAAALSAGCVGPPPRVVLRWLPRHRRRLTAHPRSRPSRARDARHARRAGRGDRRAGRARAASIRVFDVDLVADRLEQRRAHRGGSRAFLRGSRHARLEIIVHDTRWIEASCAAAARPAAPIQPRDDDLPDRRGARGAMDPLVIVDGRHYLHRFHLDQPRAALGDRRAAGRATAGHALRGDLGHRRAGTHRDDAGAVTPARARRGEARPTAARRCGARLRGSARSPRPGRGGSGPCRAFRRSSRPTAGSRRA